MHTLFCMLWIEDLSQNNDIISVEEMNVPLNDKVATTILERISMSISTSIVI